MFALVHDVNISGAIQLSVESAETLRDMLDDAQGRWVDWGNGHMLLSEPEAQLFDGISTPEEYAALDDPYPDFLVTATSIERA